MSNMLEIFQMVLDKYFGRAKPKSFEEMQAQVMDWREAIIQSIGETRGEKVVPAPGVAANVDLTKSANQKMNKLLDEMKQFSEIGLNDIQAQLKATKSLHNSLNKLSFYCSTAIAKERVIKVGLWLQAGVNVIIKQRAKGGFEHAIRDQNRLIGDAKKKTGFLGTKAGIQEARKTVKQTQQLLKTQVNQLREPKSKNSFKDFPGRGNKGQR